MHTQQGTAYSPYVARLCAVYPGGSTFVHEAKEKHRIHADILNQSREKATASKGAATLDRLGKIQRNSESCDCDACFNRCLWSSSDWKRFKQCDGISTRLALSSSNSASAGNRDAAFMSSQFGNGSSITLGFHTGYFLVKQVSKY